MQNRYLPIDLALSLLQVSSVELQNLENQGKIQTQMSLSGEKLYSELDLARVKAEKESSSLLQGKASEEQEAPHKQNAIAESKKSDSVYESLPLAEPNETLVTVAQAASGLGVSTKTIRRLMHSGKLLPQARGKFGQLLLNVEDVRKLKKNQSNPLLSNSEIENALPVVSQPAVSGEISPNYVQKNEANGHSDLTALAIHQERIANAIETLTAKIAQNTKPKDKEPDFWDGSTHVQDPNPTLTEHKQFVETIGTSQELKNSLQNHLKTHISPLRIVSATALANFLIIALVAGGIFGLLKSGMLTPSSWNVVINKFAGDTVGSLLGGDSIASSKLQNDKNGQAAGNYLSLEGGLVKGFVQFTGGAKFGTDSLNISKTGAITTNQSITIRNNSLRIAGGTITVGGNEIINSTGQIPGLTGQYIADLDGSELTHVNADHLDGIDSSSFFRQDQGGTIHGATNFTATPGGNGVGGGPVYINPGNAAFGYTLLGVAVNDQLRFRVDAQGNTTLSGNLIPSNNGTQDIGTSTQQFGNLWLAGGINGSGTWTISNNNPTLVFNDTSAGEDSYNLNVDGSSLFIRNTTQGTNFLTINGSGDTTLSGNLAVNGGSITTTQTTANLLNTNATTLNIGGAATAISLGASSGTTTINNNLTVSGSSGVTLSNGERIANGTDNQVDITYGATGGTLNLANGSNLTTDQTTFNLLNTGVTTLNIGGQATTLTLGAATGTATINNTTISFPNATSLATSLLANMTTANAFTLNPASGTTYTFDTSATSANIFNTTSTTVNAFGAATTLNLGAATGTATFGNQTITFSNATTFNALTALAKFDTLEIGGGYGSTGLSVATTGALTTNSTIQADGQITGTGGLSITGGTVALNVNSNNNTNINTGTSTGTITIGNLTTSDLVLNDAQWMISGLGAAAFNSTLQVGSTSSVAYSRFGTATTGHSLSGADSVLISGNLEVDGTAYFDGTFDASNSSGSFLSLTVGGGYGSTGVTIDSSGNLSMNGDLLVDGLTTNGGNVILGSTAANTITFNGVVDSNITPETNNTYNFGSAAKRWNTGYFNTIDASTIVGVVATGSTTSNSWTINADNATANGEVSSLAFETGSNPINAVLQWNASGDVTRITGYDDTNLFNYPIAIYSEVSGGNQTFTSGSLFKYGQNALHAITQTGAFLGTNIDFSSNITVPNSSNGNQTGSKVTLKDGGASATAIGFQTAGTLDYGLDLGGTIGTADIRLQNAATISNTSVGILALGATTVTTSGNLNVNSGTGTITSGLINGQTISSAANFTGTVAINTSLSINGGTALTTTNQTGIGSIVMSSSPTIASPTFTGTIATPLTANRAVFTDGSGNLAVSGASSALAAALTDETGTGSVVFATAPTVTTLTVSSGGAAITGNSSIIGNVGIGTTSPNAKLESLATTEQLRLSYDATHNARFTVDSSGDVTIANASFNLVKLTQNLGGGSTYGGFDYIDTNRDLGFRSASAKGIAFFVNGNATSGTPSMFISSAGNVGVGTATPSQKFDVNFAGAGAIATFGDSGTNNGRTNIDSIGTSRFYQYNSTGSIANLLQANGASYLTGGNVGIGTTSPGSALHVATSSTSSTSIRLENTSSGGSQWAFTTYGSGVAGKIGDLVITNNSTTMTPLYLSQNGSITVASANYTAPTALLDIVGDCCSPTASLPQVRLQATWYTSGTATTNKPQLLIEPTGTTSTAWSTSGTGLGINSAAGFTGNLVDLQVAASSKFVVNGSGNVGIGTASPTALLDVQGQNCVACGSPTSRGINLIADSNSLVQAAGGPIVITAGNSAGAGRTGGAVTITGGNGADNNGVGGAITLTPGSGASTTPGTGGVLALRGGLGGAGGGAGGAITFSTASLNSFTEAMRITSGGNIGIGTTSPSYPLDLQKNVVSNIYARLGTTQTLQTADLAFGNGTRTWGLRTNGNSTGDFQLMDLTQGSAYLTVVGGASGGNVGIGTATPGAYKLNVNGNTNITGTLNVTSTSSFGGALDMQNNIISNIGNAGTDFLSNGGLTLANALTVTTGGATVTAGGLTVTAGGATITAGNLGIGVGQQSHVGIYMDGAILSGASQYGLNIQPTISSAALTSATAGYFRIDTAAATFTVPSAYGIYAATPTLGLNSTITTNYGSYIQNQGASGITNAYGLYIEAPSGASSTNIGLYNAGTSTLVGNVGIGSTTASSLLSVNGNVAIGTSYIGTAAPTNGAIIQGNIGIGTTSPVSNAKVDIRHTAALPALYLSAAGATSPNIFFASTTDGFNIDNSSGTLRFIDETSPGAGDGSVRMSLTNTGALTVSNGITVTTGGQTISSGNLTLSSGLVQQTGSGNNYFMGNVGIGTTTPQRPMQIISDAGGGALRFGSDNTNYAELISGGLETRLDSIGSRPLKFSTNSSVRATIDSGGNFGIGTTGPASLLSVSGNLSIGTSYVGTAAPTNGAIIQGNVGIGTTTPAHPLDITYTATSTSSISGVNINLTHSTNAVSVLAGADINLTNATIGAAVTTAHGIRVNNPTATGAITGFSGLTIANPTTATNNSGIIIGQLSVPTGNFGIYNSSSYSNYFAGNVGIGTTGPTAALQILNNADYQLRLTRSGVANYDFNVDSSGRFSIGDFASRYLTISSGNIGIGTDTPGAYKLNVNGNTNITGTLNVTSTTTHGGAIDMQNNIISNIGNAGTDFLSNGGLTLANALTVTTGGATVTAGGLTVTAGNLGVGTTPSSSIGVQVAGSIISGTSQYGIVSNANYLSSATTAGYGIWSRVNLANQSWTMPSAYAGYFGNTTLGGSSALVTNNYGTYIESMTTGSTNNYGSYINQPGIANSIASTTDSIALDIPTATVAMGNQTGTTTNAFSAFFGVQTYTSTTNTRTITNPATVYIAGAPVASTNVSFTNAATALYVNSGVSYFGGNVGIGTSSPAAQLDINPNPSSGNHLIVRDNTGTTTFRVNDNNAFTYALATGTYTGVSLSSGQAVFSGNVGIGTTTPGTLLDVYGSDPIARIRQTNTAGTANSQLVFTTTGAGTSGNQQAISFQDNGTAYASIDARIGDQLRIGTRSSLPLAFFTNGTSNTRMLIDSSGNVGIGTTGPQSKIDFGTSAANNKIVIGTYMSGNQWTGIGMDTSTAGLRLAGDVSGNNSPLVDIGLYSNDASHTWTSRMYVAGNGNVGIGTTTPGTTLHIGAGTVLSVNDGGGTLRNPDLQVTKTSGFAMLGVAVNNGTNDRRAGFFVDQTNAMWGLSGSYTSGAIPFVIRGGGSASEQLRIDTTGNVGIGTTNPIGKLDIYVGNPGTGLSSLGGAAIQSNTHTYLAFNTPTDLQQGITFNVANSNKGGITWEAGTRGDLLEINSVTGAIDFAKAGSSKVRIDTNGNVGIGTTTPNFLMQMHGSSTPYLQFTNSTTGSSATNGSIIGLASTGVLEIRQRSNFAISFHTSDNEKMRISAAGGLSLGNSYVGTDPGAGSMILSGNLGIGTSTPGATLDLASSVTSGTASRITANSLTTGTALQIASTSITSGKFLNINNGSDVFTVTNTDFTTSLPANFTAPGDTSFAYDINLTNSTASYIKSNSQMYLQAGETFGSSDLTLRTFNSGQGVFDFAGGVSLVQAQAWNLLTSSTSALNIKNSSGTSIFNIDSTNNRIGIGTATPAGSLDIAASGTGVAVYMRDTTGSAGTLRFTNASGINYIQSGLTTSSASAADLRFTDMNASNTWLTIKSTGNVGIGTATPGSFLLNVNGTTNLGGATTVASGNLTLTSGNLILGADNAYVGMDSQNNHFWNNTTGASVWNTKGVAYINIDSNNNDSDTTALYIGKNQSTASSSNNIMAIIENGNVGIGTITPSANLDVTSSTTTGTALGINVPSLTSGVGLTINGPASGFIPATGGGLLSIGATFGSALGTYQLATIAPVNSSLGLGSEGDGLVISGTDASNTVHTGYGVKSTFTLTGNAAKSYAAYNGSVTSNSTVADSIYGAYLSVNNSGIITTGARTVYGFLANPTSSGLSTGGTTDVIGGYINYSAAGSTGSTINTYGIQINGQSILTTGGTINTYGVYVGSPTTSTTGTSTQYGLYLANQTGSDTNYAIYSAGGQSYFAGNVGLGTTSPSYALQVNGSTGLALTSGYGTVNSTGAAHVVLGANSSSPNAGSLSFGDNSGWKFHIGTNVASTFTPRVTFMDNGNVGIGTITPSVKLDVRGGAVAISNNTYYGLTNSSGVIAVGLGTDTSNNIYVGDTSAFNNIYLRPGAATAMTILNNGNIGIGTTTPSQKLHVENGELYINNGGAAKISLGAGGSYINRAASLFQFNTDGVAYVWKHAESEKMRLDTGGNLGIGTATPGALLHVASSTLTGTAAQVIANSLTTGTALQLTSTSITSGKFLNINNGSDVFSVSNTDFTTSLPANFTAAGDVSIAYDINFTNPTSSFIKSAAPITIQSGETFNSSNLTLKTYNSGQGVLDFAGGVSLVQAQTWTSQVSSTTALTIKDSSANTILNIDTTNDRVGIGTTSAGNKLVVVGGSDAFSTDIYGLASGSFLRLGTQSGGIPTIDARNNANSANVNMALQLNGGDITIGSGSSSNGVTLSTTASTAERGGTARRGYTVTLKPEYEGAVLTAPATSESLTSAGNMTSDFCAGASVAGFATTPVNNSASTGCPTATDIHNFYQWVSTDSSTNYYDIFVRWQVPSDFSDWDTIGHSGAYIRGYGYVTNTSNDDVTVTVYDTGGTARASNVSIKGSAGAWSSLTNILTSNTGTWTPGGYVTIKVRMKSNTTAGYTRVGELELYYLSKFK